MRTAQLLRAARELSATLTSSLAPQDVLLHTVERVALELGAERSSILIEAVDTTSETAYLFVSSDRREPRELDIELAGYPELQQALRTNALLEVADPASNALFNAVRRHFDTASLGPVVLAPLRLQQRVSGVLVVHLKPGAAALDRAARDFCVSVANALALALGRRSKRPTRDSTRARNQRSSLRATAACFDAVDKAIALMDTQGRIVYANRSARQLLGYSADAAPPQSSELVLEVDKPALELVQRQLYTERRAQEVELRLLAGNGEVRHCRVTFNPLEGEETFYVLSLRHVGPGRRQERALERTRRLLESIVQLSNDAILVFDERNHLRLINRAAESLLAWNARDALESLELSHIDTTGAVADSIEAERSRRTTGRWRTHIPACVLRTRLGTELPVRAQAMALADAGDEQGFVLLLNNSERVSISSKAPKTTSILEFDDPWGVLFEGGASPSSADAARMLAALRNWIVRSPYPFGLMSPSGHVVAWNAALRTVLERAGLRGTERHLAGVVVDADQALLRDACLEAEVGALWTHVDLRLGDVEEDIVHLRLALSRREDRQGDYAGMLLFGIDLSEIDALEEQIIQTEKLATLGQLAAGVVHELNNPLTSISVYGEYLLAKADKSGNTSSDTDKLQRIVDNTQRILRFTRDLVAYARPAAETPVPTPINTVLTQSASFCEHVLANAGVELALELADDLGDVLCVPEQLQQVFINLITNACQAIHHERGRIRLLTRDLGRLGVTILVEDNGDGIPASQHGRIFEPFFSTKRDEGGTGLGLSIVRNILHQHGGNIEMESQIGRGTRFTLRLPRRPPRTRRVTREIEALKDS